MPNNGSVSWYGKDIDLVNACAKRRNPFEELPSFNRPILFSTFEPVNTPTGSTVQSMDSPLISHLFRRLFARPSRDCLRLPAHPATRAALGTQQRRSYVLGRKRQDEDGGSRWQQRIDAFPKDMSKQLREYPKVTSVDLRNRSHRPRRVKMLARDFVEGWRVLMGELYA